uniref:Uncharacterized protein n=1 Tax=Arundo donax TaxID=35708 RepID=A0A0A9D5P7_ARUDO
MTLIQIGIIYTPILIVILVTKCCSNVVFGNWKEEKFLVLYFKLETD